MGDFRHSRTLTSEPATLGATAIDDAPTSDPAEPQAPNASGRESEIAVQRRTANGYGDLAAIIRLQSTELERLANENDQLIERLEHVRSLHDSEQRLRLELQQQVQRLNEQVAALPAPDAVDIRREARDEVVQEIKPVLVAMMDLLELAMQRPADAEPAHAESADPAITDWAEAAAPVPVDEAGPAGTAAEHASGDPTPALAPVATTADQNADDHLVEKIREIDDDLAGPPPEPTDGLNLPQILTRPLEELTGRAARRVQSDEELANDLTGTEAKATGPRTPRPRPSRDYGGSGLPQVFSWINLFA